MQFDASFILQILAVFLGGSSVQGLIFLFRRRAEIRELDSKADAVGLDAATNLISRLQLDGEQVRAQLTQLRAEQVRENEEMIAQLTACTDEGMRMRRDIALLRNEIGIARRQIEQLAPTDPSTWPPRHRLPE